jgi:outer membrane receptor protein involved in Fe transport
MSPARALRGHCRRIAGSLISANAETNEEQLEEHPMIGRRRHHFSASTALATVIAGSATVVFAVLPAPRASAQESGTQASKIEEVVVTARRRDESLLRVPATIQALTGKELASQSINTEADLQRAVPGLVIRESLSSNQLNYSIRGQSVDAFSSSSPGVLSYFNEFQATATSASGLYDLQSIQVVKGPQGTLYGRNTTGGAVLYTTAKPTDEFAAGLNVKLGDYAMRSAEGFVSTPLAGDKAQLRIAGKMLKRDGFQDNEYNGKEIGSADYTSGRWKASRTAPCSSTRKPAVRTWAPRSTTSRLAPDPRTPPAFTSPLYRSGAPTPPHILKSSVVALSPSISSSAERVPTSSI